MRKNGYCLTCGDGAIWDAVQSDEDKPIWRCRCCLVEIPRRVLKTKRKERIKKLFAEFEANYK